MLVSHAQQEMPNHIPFLPSLEQALLPLSYSCALAHASGRAGQYHIVSGIHMTTGRLACACRELVATSLTSPNALNADERFWASTWIMESALTIRRVYIRFSVPQRTHKIIGLTLAYLAKHQDTAASHSWVLGFNVANNPTEASRHQPQYILVSHSPKNGSICRPSRLAVASLEQ